MKYVIGLMAIYLVYSFVRFHYVLRTADLPEIKQTSAVLGTGPRLIYVAAGDSTALGEGASNEQRAFPYLIAAKLAVSNQVEYVNIGVSGATTGDLLTDQLAKIIELKPDLITIAIGANDITHWKSSSQTLKNFETIKKELTSKTSAKILISNVANLNNPKLLPRFYAKLTDKRARNINRDIQLLSDDRFVVVDIHSVQTPLSADLFHPSDKGYENWAQAYLSSLTK